MKMFDLWLTAISFLVGTGIYEFFTGRFKPAWYAGIICSAIAISIIYWRKL